MRPRLSGAESIVIIMCDRLSPALPAQGEPSTGRTLPVKSRPMPLHPQAALAIQRAGDLPTNLSPDELRVAYERQRLTLLPEKPAVAITYQLSIPSDYGPIPARFYRADKDRRPCPLLVFFHGGGFMLGTLALYDTTCRRLAVQGDCAVLSVDYRLAPETQFPGAVLDSYAATRWASDNAELLNIDPAKDRGGRRQRRRQSGGGGGADGAGLAGVQTRTADIDLSHDRSEPRISVL